jgi:hypothetical protein
VHSAGANLLQTFLNGAGGLRDSATHKRLPTAKSRVGFAALNPPYGIIGLVRRLLRLRMQVQLLHAPVRSLGNVNLVLRRACERVGAGELLEVTS